jgi:hypothetical protein
MKIDIQTGNIGPWERARVGNVYPIKGGRGLRDGHMQVLIAITEPTERWQGPAALLLVIDKEGNPRGVNSYGLHAIEDLQPIAFVDGLDQLTLTMRSL